MLKATVILAGLALAGGAVGAALVSPAQELAGRYVHSFQDAMVDGTTYTATNTVEIAAIDATHAYLNFELDFFNGHICTFYGVATFEKNALIYRERPEIALGETPCQLTVQRKGDKLTWDDGGSCNAFCGARGSFREGDIAWSSKRAITDIAALKASRRYESALHEWRTGKRLDP